MKPPEAARGHYTYPYRPPRGTKSILEIEVYGSRPQIRLPQKSSGICSASA